MSVFRRRRHEDGAAERGEDDAAQAAERPDDDAGMPADADAGAPSLTPRPDGPWDSGERAGGDTAVDLGGLRLPGRDGMELRLEVEESTGTVNGVAVVLGGSAVLLHAYAAPRSEGIWGEIREEIAAGVTRQGGTATEVEGPFGPELVVRLPVRTPEGRTGHQVQRFAGVDGPRWFLRAVFQGPAAQDQAAAAELESVVRDVVVVRGTEAMAPRELLPLRLPDAAPLPEPEPEGRSPLQPFERGPEITEIR